MRNKSRVVGAYALAILFTWNLLRFIKIAGDPDQVGWMGILESLDPWPGLWTRKCWTLDRDFWKSRPKTHKICCIHVLISDLCVVCFWAEISVQSPAFLGPKHRSRVQRFQKAGWMGKLNTSMVEMETDCLSWDKPIE